MPHFVGVLFKQKNAPAYTWCASKKAIATLAPRHRSKWNNRLFKIINDNYYSRSPHSGQNLLAVGLVVPQLLQLTNSAEGCSFLGKPNI